MTRGATQGVQLARKSLRALNERIYNVDVEVSDHTAAVEMKIVDTSNGRKEALLLVIWMKLLKNAFEGSIGAFVVLSLKKQHTRIGALGTGWKLRQLRSRAVAPQEEKRLYLLCSRITAMFDQGFHMPYVFSRTVDAAQQVMTGQGEPIEMAELIVQLKGNRQSLPNDNEKGVRIIFKCVDLGDPNAVETSVLWVLSMSNMLTAAGLPHDKVLRIIAQPGVQDESIMQ